MTVQHNVLIATAGFCVGLALSACHGSEKNPNHCLYAQGNQTCAGYDWPDGIERPYCVDECHPQVNEYNGCVEEEPSDLECYSPCGGEQNALEDDSCLGTADESTDSGTDTTAEDTTTDSETGPDPCMSDEDCTDGAAPFCGAAGECVPCSGMEDPDAACAGVDGGANPVCAGDSCVQCTAENAEACLDLTPVCDEGTNTCVGCDWHEQCNDACHMKEGSCFPDNVILVTGVGVETLTEAIAEVEMLPSKQAVLVLYSADMDVDYLESVVVPTGVVVAFVPDDGAAVTPEWQGQNGLPALTIESGAVVYIQGIRIANSTAEGIVVDGGELWADRSEVVNNDGGGIVVNGGGSLVLRNSFVGGFSPGAPLQIPDGTTDVIYSTIGASAGPLAALECADGTGSTVRNSIVVFSNGADPNGGEIICPNLELLNNAVEGTFADNESLGDMNAMWFSNFNGGNFHLNPQIAPAIVATAATWQPGDPLVDIDGDPRPIADGSSDYAGADRLP